MPKDEADLRKYAEADLMRAIVSSTLASFQIENSDSQQEKNKNQANYDYRILSNGKREVRRNDLSLQDFLNAGGIEINLSGNMLLPKRVNRIGTKHRSGQQKNKK